MIDPRFLVSPASEQLKQVASADWVFVEIIEATVARIQLVGDERSPIGAFEVAQRDPRRDNEHGRCLNADLRRLAARSRRQAVQ
jgi:hypothetical protein